MLVFQLLVFIPFLLLSSTANSSVSSEDDCYATYDTLMRQMIYTIVDEMPEFPGGPTEVSRFFIAHFNQPQQDDFQSYLPLEFVVDTLGNVDGTRIRNKNMDQLTPSEREALRVIQLMSGWKPGKCEGKPVPVRMILPIRLSPESR